MRVLAIDPGYDRLGMAVVEGDPSKPTHIWSDCVTPEKGAPAARLSEVFTAITSAIEQHSPEYLAIEQLFFSTNAKTALKVAEARGVILAAAGVKDLEVREFSPQEVKLAVTGYGAADKKAVAAMVPKLISLPPLAPPKQRLDDELDAIALGIAALSRRTH